jgi:hypothetical protein
MMEQGNQPLQRKTKSTRSTLKPFKLSLFSLIAKKLVFFWKETKKELEICQTTV